MNIKSLIISEEDLKKIADQQQEELSYDVWNEALAEISKSIIGQIPQGTSRFDRVSYLARQSSLVGFMRGVILINELIKSYAAEETNAE